jgi:hypothetical protein
LIPNRWNDYSSGKNPKWTQRLSWELQLPHPEKEKK